MAFVKIETLIQLYGLWTVLLSLLCPKNKQCIYFNSIFKKPTIRLIGNAYFKLWHTWGSLNHPYFRSFGELQMMVTWWLWALWVPPTLSKLLEVLGRAALLLHYFLLSISPFWKGDSFDVAHMLGSPLALTGFWLSAMLTILLCYVTRRWRHCRFFRNWNKR